MEFSIQLTLETIYNLTLQGIGSGGMPQVNAFSGFLFCRPPAKWA